MTHNYRHKFKEVRQNALCPCGSTLKYKFCCQNKAFKWGIDNDGNFVKHVPLVDSEARKAAQRAVKLCKKNFSKVFERTPIDDDPLFLDKYIFSDTDLERDMVKVMQEANLRPEIIYAYQKTGLIITKSNFDLIPTKDIEDWNKAIDDYFSNKGKLDKVSKAFEDLNTELESCIFAFGLFLDKEINGGKINSKKILSTLKEYIFFLHIKVN